MNGTYNTRYNNLWRVMNGPVIEIRLNTKLRFPHTLFGGGDEGGNEG